MQDRLLSSRIVSNAWLIGGLFVLEPGLPGRRLCPSLSELGMLMGQEPAQCGEYPELLCLESHAGESQMRTDLPLLVLVYLDRCGWSFSQILRLSAVCFLIKKGLFIANGSRNVN